jgi:uncharacterized protein (TIGR03437 family)
MIAHEIHRSARFVEVIRSACLALLMGVVPLVAQPPAISQNGVVNAASRIPPTLAGGALARGSQFTIYGVRFGASERTARVTLRHGQSTIAASIISVRPKRIDAWLPDSIPSGPAVLTVKVNGQSSTEFKVEVVDSNPGLFSRNGEGWGPAAIRNAEDRPLHPGQRVTLLGTGFAAGRNITVVVGNRTAAAGAPRAMARGQQGISFTIPADAPVGCYVPVYVLAAAKRASNVVTVPIRADEGPCDPGPLPLLSAERIGVTLLARSRMRARTTNIDTTSDEALITFAAKSDQPVLFPLLLLPPAGTCTAYTSSFQAETILPNSISAAIVAEVGGRGLKAGTSMTLTNAGGVSRAIPQDGGAAGYYRAQLGSTGRRGRPLLLQPGEVMLVGPGGADVGPFTWKARTSEPFEWTDREEISVVDRSRPLTLHWSGVGADRIVLVLATNVDQISTAIGTTLCAVRGAAGQFTIPPSMLANIPASKDLPGVPFDQLFVVSIAAKAATAMQAPGLTEGAVLSLYAIGRMVEYR